MKRITNLAGIILLLVSVILFPSWVTVAQTEITDGEVRSILQDRVDRSKKSVGIVVGLVDDKGTRIICYGKPSRESAQIVDGDSVFEIGSVTKVFTAILLADLIERGEVTFNDQNSKYQTKSVKPPSQDGKEIPMQDLSSQISG